METLDLETEVLERFEESAKIPVRNIPGWLLIAMQESGIKDFTKIP